MWPDTFCLPRKKYANSAHLKTLCHLRNVDIVMFMMASTEKGACKFEKERIKYMVLYNRTCLSHLLLQFHFFFKFPCIVSFKLGELTAFSTSPICHSGHED